MSTTSKKIIDNKLVSLTDAEWTTYESICRSYDRANFKGEELFKDLFETDESGMIIFLRPPSNKYISMEVFLFISGIMIHQHIRHMHEVSSSLHAQMQEKMKELDSKLAKLK